jgi:hypothetical protein
LLRVSEDLVEEALRFEGVLGEDASKDPLASPGPSAASAGEVPDSAAGAAAPDASGKPAPKAPPPRSTTSAEPSAPPNDRSNEPSGAGAPWVWGVAAGADVALFSFAGDGILGPRVGLFAELPATFVLQLTGLYDFGLGAGDAVDVRMAGGSAVIAKRLGPAESLEIGAGLVAGSVFVTADPTIQPPSLAEWFGGVLVRGRYGLREGGWRFSVGPEIRVHAIRPEVAVDHTVVWGVPLVSVGLGLEVSRDIFGSR